MGPTTKKKSTDKNDDSAKAKKLEKALREGRADAKQEFELQRTEIYDTLSASYKRMFGQIIFAKWKKVYLPALVLSPYSVPPGPVRTMWMEKFEKVTYCDDCATVRRQSPQLFSYLLFLTSLSLTYTITNISVKSKKYVRSNDIFNLLVR